MSLELLEMHYWLLVTANTLKPVLTNPSFASRALLCPTLVLDWPVAHSRKLVNDSMGQEDQRATLQTRCKMKMSDKRGEQAEQKNTLKSTSDRLRLHQNQFQASARLQESPHEDPGSPLGRTTSERGL